MLQKAWGRGTVKECEVVRSMSYLATILFSFAVIVILRCVYLASGKCPKHEALLHNFKPVYALDKGETIELWAKLIPEPWQDNRLIGSLSNSDYLAFNLTRRQTSSEQQGIGVVSRDVIASVRQNHQQTGKKKRLSETTEDVLFTIKAFSEDTSCVTLKAETNITVGCPLNRRIFPRGKPVSCDGFKNYSFVILSNQRKGIFLADQEVMADKRVEYDFFKLGCPFTVLKKEPFKPVIDLYDGETLVKEVDANYVLWEHHGRVGFQYSATMKEAGCTSEAQSWEKMVKFVEGQNKETAWSKTNYRSCFEDITNGPVNIADLDQPYEILNSSTASSHVLWNDVGMFLFTLTVIDPDFSFCNLTVEFGVQVIDVGSRMEEIPTFVVLGSSCLTIAIVILSAYYTTVVCWN